MQTSTFHALLIGIDHYLPNKLPDGGSYPSLGGCVRDVASMEDLLRQKLEIPGERVIKLAAPVAGIENPPEPNAQWPTYENIVNAFCDLTDGAAPGDQVYIHYCGHGGRVPTRFPDLKGAAGLDETLVPMDVGKAEARHLRDVELAYLLKKMADKGLIVTLVLDCCHSGGATRGRGNVAMRGIRSIDTTPRSDAVLAASEAELILAWRDLAGDTKRNVNVGESWFWKPQGYVLLAACRPSEFAYEYAFDGRETHGVLTYWLLESLKQLGPGLNYKQLYERILAKIHSRFPTQTPMLVGDGDRMVFGADRVKPIYAVPVLQTDPVTERVQLQTGESQNVHRGAQFAIYPLQTSDFARTNERLALVEIADAGAAISWAKITTRFSSSMIESGSLAVLLDPGQMRLRRNVRPVALRNTAGEADALRRLEGAVRNGGNGWVQLTELDEDVHYQVVVNEKEEYEVWDPAGIAFPNLRPAIIAGTDTGAARLVQRLVHMSKYHSIEQLDNPDTMSSLARKLIVEWYSLPEDFDPATDKVVPLPSSVTTDQSYLSSGEWIGLRIKNASSRVLNIAVLDLQPDWGITQILPVTEGMFFEPVDPGMELSVPLHTYLPPDYDEGTDVIKVFATVAPANFRWLEMPALDEPTARTIRTPEIPANALEQLFATLAAAKQLKRHATVAAYRDLEWATAQVVLKVKRMNP